MTDKIDFLQDEKSSVALVDRMIADSALKTVNAARCSYDNEKSAFDDKDKKLTKFLWTHEHTSPFRHSYYTFQVKLPIYVARQLMKYGRSLLKSSTTCMTSTRAALGTR
jgi:thymidylate synthase (FAD)